MFLIREDHTITHVFVLITGQITEITDFPRTKQGCSCNMRSLRGSCPLRQRCSEPTRLPQIPHYSGSFAGFTVKRFGYAFCQNVHAFFPLSAGFTVENLLRNIVTIWLLLCPFCVRCQNIFLTRFNCAASSLATPSRRSLRMSKPFLPPKRLLGISASRVSLSMACTCRTGTRRWFSSVPKLIRLPRGS